MCGVPCVLLALLTVLAIRATRPTGFEMNDIPSDTATKIPDATSESEAQRKPLSPAAQRALAEAEERRAAAAAQANATATAKEFQGPTGPEPTRFGDWERKGIASDF
jgi:hypothetical protein